MASNSPVLIVGAGPAGLTMALALRRHGIPVRIIDKSPEFHVGSRGSGTMPRTLEVYGYLGILQDVLANGYPLVPMRTYQPDGRTPLKTWDLMSKLESSPQCPHIGVVDFGQNALEEVLRTHLERSGCSVELATALENLDQDDDGVTAYLTIRRDRTPLREKVRVQYVIGADGARGVTRKLLKLKFEGQTSEMDELVVGDVEASGLSTNFWHMWGTPQKSNTCISLRPLAPDKQLFAIFMVGHNLAEKELKKEEHFREFFLQHTGRDDIVLGEFRWLSYFKPHMRMVDKFSEGRVFLVGDAAHVHSPTGGQGMNSSVQDSFNLAWKLALVIRRHAGPHILSTYDEERLPVIAEMLGQTSQVHTRTFKSKGPTSQDQGGWTRAPLLYMLGVNYRWSPIVLDERHPPSEDKDELRSRSYGGFGNFVCAGDRAPEAPGLQSRGSQEKTTLFKIFSPVRHTALVFPGSDTSQVRGLVDAVTGRYSADLVRTTLILRQPLTDVPPNCLALVDTRGLAHGAYQINGTPTVVIVRPDGVIGAIVRGVDGLTRYFSMVLGR